MLYRIEAIARKDAAWHKLPVIYTSYEYASERLADKVEVWTGWKFRLVNVFVHWSSYEVDSNLVVVEKE